MNSLSIETVKKICSSETQPFLTNLQTHLQTLNILQMDRSHYSSNQIFNIGDPLFKEYSTNEKEAYKKLKEITSNIIAQLFMATGLGVLTGTYRWMINEEGQEELIEEPFDLIVAYKNDKRAVILQDPENDAYIAEWVKNEQISCVDIVYPFYNWDKWLHSYTHEGFKYQQYILSEYLAVQFGDEVSKTIINHLKTTVNQTKKILGLKTVHQFTPFNLYLLKEQAAKSLKSFNYAAPIISDEFISDISEAEIKNLQHQFIDDEKHKVLLTDFNFAQSFITSEYLFLSFSSFMKSDSVDFTSIVSGYLKSIEQLLSEILKLYYGSGKKITATAKFIKKMNHDYGKEVKEADVSEDYINKRYCSTELGSLIKFYKKNPNCWLVSDVLQDKITNLLNAYRGTMRNGYFHKDNLYDWQQVINTRNFTIYLYCLILTGLKTPASFEQHIKDDNGDEFDKIATKIEDSHMHKFILKMQNGEVIKAFHKYNSEMPNYKDNGTRSYQKLTFTRVSDFSNKEHKHLDDLHINAPREYQKLNFDVTRENMPIEIYGQDGYGNWQKLKGAD